MACMSVTITLSLWGNTQSRSHGEDTAYHAGETLPTDICLVSDICYTCYMFFTYIHIIHSPFEVQVSEEAGPQKVRAWGPGLETGMVGKSADFVVEAIGMEVGTLGT